MLISRLVLAAAMATSLTVPALAEDAPAAKRLVANAPPALQVCKDTALARMAWEREHGAMTFVTADQIASGQLASEARPLCITEAQLARLNRMIRQARLEDRRQLASR